MLFVCSLVCLFACLFVCLLAWLFFNTCFLSSFSVYVTVMRRAIFTLTDKIFKNIWNAVRHPKCNVAVHSSLVCYQRQTQSVPCLGGMGVHIRQDGGWAQNPYLLRNGIWGGGVVLKFHFKIPFLQSCFLNDQYSSSFHVFGKQMKIKYLLSTCQTEAAHM